MGALGNPKHEIFAQHVAAGMQPREAYTRAGFEPSRGNFHRLMKKPHVARRIAELIDSRERLVAAARMQPEEIIQVLRERGNIDRVADFFALNGAECTFGICGPCRSNAAQRFYGWFGRASDCLRISRKCRK